GHLLGTDFLGRDILSRLIVGIQAYFLPGLLAIVISLLLGTTLGALASYRSGEVETLVTYFNNLIDSIPRLVLILLVIAAFKPGIYYIMVVVGVTGVPAVASLIAGKIGFLRQKNFIEAAHVLGLPSRVILLKHILWHHCMPLLVIQATIGMGEAILIETSLSYLGFGVQEPTPSWGNMVQAGANYFFQGKFWPSTAPALSILGLLNAGPGVISGKIAFRTDGGERNLLHDLEHYITLGEQDGRIMEVSKDEAGWRKQVERIMAEVRGKEIAMIFQNPKSAL